MTIKRVLITGAAGFSGRYIYSYLDSLGVGLDLICSDIVKPSDSCCDKFVAADLSCAKAVDDLIKQANPDYIIHLAGTFGTGDSAEIYKVNVLSMASLLEAVLKHASGAVVVAAGSAAEYGSVTEEQLPVDEQTPCRPVMPYGLSKQLATQIAMYYHRVHNICTMIVRPFQLIGSGVTTKLAPGAFAQQLHRAIAEGGKVIKVGNLESSRDFLDIHDAVSAIWALCQKPACGEIFNLCSGKPVRMAELLETMIEQCGAEVKIEIDTRRLRGKRDVSCVYGSYQKINQHCGWQPTTSLAESIQSMFE